ncbi:Hypothetical predicted protein [Xyrichtys novacula]|uniref:Uncharacterized protein n=1 Tax=Xyrichtys novacula TaxID=13765 RepID=A0AAV1F4Q2_XYRNO|nr:Hypothetical predicted protein [Xyrichtys novacula]
MEGCLLPERKLSGGGASERVELTDRYLYRRSVRGLSPGAANMETSLTDTADHRRHESNRFYDE